jgi:hypothetical protein
MVFLLIYDAGEKGVGDAPPFRADGILSANAPGGKGFDKDLPAGKGTSTSL